MTESESLTPGRRPICRRCSAGKEDNEGCVDLYYRAARHSWQYMESPPGPTVDPRYQAAWQIYQQSLAHLITTGCRYGRLDPRGRLIVADSSGRRVVPITYYGFPWKPNEFCQVLCAGDFHSRDINHHYQTIGLGISLVAIRQSCGNELFYSSRQHFPVTAVLRPACSKHDLADGSIPSDPHDSGAVLEFYNPYLFDSLPVGPILSVWKENLTAPFACLLKDTPRKFTEGFIDPSDADIIKPQLLMMEPYQRGKIPVVFIHGLWWDSVTWVDAVNDLRGARGHLSAVPILVFQVSDGERAAAVSRGITRKAALGEGVVRPRPNKTPPWTGWFS